MKAKKIITIVLTVIVFFTAAFLGVSAVYRVEEVTLVVKNVSSPALEEAAALRTVLEEAYLKKSTIKADDAAAKSAFENFAYFRLTGFEKDYPGRLVITATEDAEVYAVANGGNYVIYSGDGTKLSVRDSVKNRADGTDNLLVTSQTENLAAHFETSSVFSFLKTLDAFNPLLPKIPHGCVYIFARACRRRYTCRRQKRKIKPPRCTNAIRTD